ncbi:MAG: hypothetical protein JXB07_21450 [Anaerolineae bacterium]|nr:hypothetical protein [Anaerolineae bacterium]
MTIDTLPGEPIISVALLAGFDFGDNLVDGIKTSFELLDSLDSPVFWILDIRSTKLGFEELLSSVNIAARGERPLWHHPMIRQLIIVSDAHIVQLAAKGLSNSVFGNLAVTVCATVEEAIDYARSKAD